MNRILLATFLGSILAGGLALAQSAYHGPEKIRTLSERDVVETLNGQRVRATTLEVTFEPGQSGLPHRHAGPIFGYVLEGELEFALDDETPRTLKTGETFYEPSGALHRVARNPSAAGRTRVLAVILHGRDEKNVTTAAEGED